MDDWRLGVRNYEYDLGSRLVAVRDGAGATLERYEYDIEGNIVSSPDFRQHVIDPGNRLRRSDGVEYEYDGAGCLLAMRDGSERLDLDWGPFDLLASVRRNGVPVAWYDYDLCGRRIRKVTPDEDIVFRHHLNVIGSLESSRNGRWDFLYAPQTFIPLAQMQDGCAWFYSFDQIGTPTELWAEDGGLVATVAARSYGSSRSVDYASASRAVSIPFHFQGQYCDAETGFHYNRFRYYAPATGRFISPDPLGLFVDANLYVYPRNPNNWIDPFGLAAVMLLNCGLKTRPFDPCEQYAAMQKLKSINKASKNRRKKTCTKCRANEQKEYFEKTCGGSPADGNQVDHSLELQLGGADNCCGNLVAIPGSVNQSFGSQIKNKIADLAEGAIVPRFAFEKPGCNQAKNCKNKDKAFQRGTKKDGKDCSKEPSLDC
jgi:RHS repeat-associated protein